MTDEPSVVLLYSARFVPPDVREFMADLVPPGFRWQVLEQGESPADRLAVLATAHYVFAYPGNPTATELAAAKQLRLFQLLSAGHDWLDLEQFRQCGIALASNDGSNAVSTAEHTVLLMLALLKQLPVHHAATTQGEWLAMERALQLRELRGKVVGLVGFGKIARHVARRVSAFEASVLYTKPSRAAPELEAPSGATHVSLDELLERCDILSLHAPLTPATRSIIDAQALQRMRPGGYLVNTARGALVDENALIEALRTGQLAGAGLDAFAQEPVAADSPLLRLANVVLTPHVAGSTRDAWVHRMNAAWANVRRVESGVPPLSRIV